LKWIWKGVEIEDVIKSPQTQGYRNKCEFSFGRNTDGEKSLGFLLGLFKNGITTVLSPRPCLHVSDLQKLIVDKIEEYARQSKLDTYDRLKQAGFFRLLLVRTLESGENMVMIQVNPQDLSEEELETEKLKFTKFITEFSDSQPEREKVDSVWWQLNDDCFNGIKDDMTMELLAGKEEIEETLMGLKFQISPFSFFQINPTATELLYTKIRDMAINAGNLTILDESEKTPGSSVMQNRDATKLLEAIKAGIDKNDPETTEKTPGVVLLDLCCGTGTIGMTLAPYVKKVIGIEMSEDAVNDAKKNAKLNGIDNIHFLCGKVEEKMHAVFTYHVDPQDTVIAILDPPRVGVHHSVVQAIRACEGVSYCLFIACDFQQSTKNVLDLCRPTSNKFKGHPFKVKTVGGVDMFPHTKHMEVVVELERHNGVYDQSDESDDKEC
jgi:tRNA (uracil-5-)-methyltransferase